MGCLRAHTNVVVNHLTVADGGNFQRDAAFLRNSLHFFRLGDRVGFGRVVEMADDGNVGVDFQHGVKGYF